MTRSYHAERFDALTDREKDEAMRKASAFDVFVRTTQTYLGIRATLPPELEATTSYEPYCYSSVELPRLPECPTVPDCPTTDGHQTLLEILLNVIYEDGYQNGRADGAKSDRRTSRRRNVALTDDLAGRMGLVDVLPDGHVE